MSVEESKMAWGSWSIDLKPETPRSILHQLWNSAFGLVRLYDQKIGPDQVTHVPGLFTGVLHGMKEFTISGAGQTWFLGESSDMWTGDWSERGPYSLSDISFDGTTDGTVGQWVLSTITNTGTGLAYGSVNASTTKHGGTLTRRTAKTIFDNFIVPVFGMEYRVTPELEVDVDTVANLYPTPSEVPLAVRRGGRDNGILGLDTDNLYPEMSVDKFLSRGTGFHEASGYDYSVYNTNSFKAPDGSDLNWGLHRSISTQSNAGWQQALDTQTTAAALAAESETVQSVTLTAKEYAITRRCGAGDYIYVYDLDRGLFDQANKITFHGRTIYPVRLRVETVNWPVQSGMYVMLDNRHNSGNPYDVTDLTQYIQFEDSTATTSITVGRPTRTLGSVIRSRR